MQIQVKFEKGVFKPLRKIEGIKEGEQVEIHIEKDDWNKLAMANPAFDFLKEEPDVYTEEDIIK